MASDSDYSDESVTSEGEMNLDEFGEEVNIVTGEPKPYQDEPLTNESESDEDEDADLDGLTRTVLEERYERRVTVREW